VHRLIEIKETPMPRESIFDPEGNQTEHSGSTFLGPRADNLSHMPPDIADGKVDEQEAADLDALARANDELEQERGGEGAQP
jgi:hypothetical protein